MSWEWAMRNAHPPNAYNAKGYLARFLAVFLGVEAHAGLAAWPVAAQPGKMQIDLSRGREVISGRIHQCLRR